MSNLILTQDQQNAYDAFASWLLTPTEEEPVLVLEGYAGTGKSTLVDKLLTDIPKMLNALSLIDPTFDDDYEIVLSATTNKACEALSDIVTFPVSTLHSVLGLTVKQDHRTGTTSVVVKSGANKIKDSIIFIDEASFLDAKTLSLVFEQTINCKIFFIGDPAQLSAVKATGTPVFSQGYPTVKLLQVVRQSEGSQIKELASAFRDTVNGEDFPQFTPDNSEVILLNEDDFHAEMLSEFGRADWEHADSKVLAWTNKTVIAYNHTVRDNLHGEPEIQVGDYATVNSYVQVGRKGLKTDQQVQISDKRPATFYGVPGHNFSLITPNVVVFVPSDWGLANAVLKKARQAHDWTKVKEISESWTDLRATYACTINKSQGSTYGKVFVDLNDIKKCRNSNQIARMLYVAVSRAKYNVYLKGDII